MNAKQKALAEKTIKLKYNGLIDGLKTVATQVEEANLDLPMHPPLQAANDYGNEDKIFRLHPSHKGDPDPLVLEKISILNAAWNMYQTALNSANEAITQANQRIKKINKERQEKRQAAATYRLNLAQALATQRDDAILQVAFKGEDEEMMQLLQSLPGPELIMKQLSDGGYALAKQLTTTTGIGSKNPDKLVGPDALKLTVTVDED